MIQLIILLILAVLTTETEMIYTKEYEEILNIAIKSMNKQTGKEIKIINVIKVESFMTDGFETVFHVISEPCIDKIIVKYHRSGDIKYFICFSISFSK